MRLPGIGGTVRPGNRTFSPTGSMGTFRHEHTVTLLSDGKVLIAGGYGYPVTAELYLSITSPGDCDGDGKTDFTVWRPSNGTWYVKPSFGAPPIVAQWGDQASGDKPVNRPVHLRGTP